MNWALKMNFNAESDEPVYTLQVMLDDYFYLKVYLKNNEEKNWQFLPCFEEVVVTMPKYS